VALKVSSAVWNEGCDVSDDGVVEGEVPRPEARAALKTVKKDKKKKEVSRDIRNEGYQ
jgi:hypothetical protein